MFNSVVQGPREQPEADMSIVRISLVPDSLRVRVHEIATSKSYYTYTDP